jgi:imidazolonepropionase-like amidohydrolase
MSWSVRAVPLPDGDRPADLWIDADGCLAAGPVAGAEPLPGRYVAPGLVDAHAHPAVGPGPAARDGTGTLDELAAWAAALRLMAQAGTAWTPTLCAVLAVPGTASDAARRRVAEYRERLGELLPLAHRLGVPVLTGTDIAGTVAREVALLAEHGLPPAAALAAATTTGYRFIGEPFDQPGRPATLVTYQDDPREDLEVLSSPSAVLIDWVRVR